MAETDDLPGEQAEQDASAVLSRLWQQMPSAQIVSNWLVTAFTFCLVVLGYVTEEPYIVPRVQPLQQFSEGKIPEEQIVFENIGRTPGYSFNTGMAIAVLPYPLGRILLTDVPINGFFQNLYPTVTIGRSIAFQIPLSDKDYAAVLDGKNRLIYVWGSIQFRDFMNMSHTDNFCFAFGGPATNKIGICSVEKPIQYHIAEEEQEPNAQAIPVPVPVLSPTPKSR